MHATTIRRVENQRMSLFLITICRFLPRCWHVTRMHGGSHNHISYQLYIIRNGNVSGSPHVPCCVSYVKQGSLHLHGNCCCCTVFSFTRNILTQGYTSSSAGLGSFIYCTPHLMTWLVPRPTAREQQCDVVEKRKCHVDPSPPGGVHSAAAPTPTTPRAGLCVRNPVRDEVDVISRRQVTHV